eukprot:jgi/Mesvir1/23881/Mv10673-RA.1
MSEAMEMQRVVGEAGATQDHMSPRTTNDRLAQKLATMGLATSPDSNDPGSPPMESHAKYLRNLRRGPTSPDQVSPGGSPSSTMGGGRGPASPMLINTSNLMKLAEGGMRRSVGQGPPSGLSGSLSPREDLRASDEGREGGGSFLPYPGPPHRQPSGGASDKRFASVEKALERERRISAVEKGQPIERAHRLSQVDRRPVDAELAQAAGDDTPPPRVPGLPPRQASGGRSGQPLIPRRRTSDVDRVAAHEELVRYGSADMQQQRGQVEANGGRPRRMSDVDRSDRGVPRVSQVDQGGRERRISQVDPGGPAAADGMPSSRERRVSDTDGGGRARRISQVDQVGRAGTVDPPGAPLMSTRERRISQVDQVGRASAVDPPGAPQVPAAGGRERRISQVDQVGRAGGAAQEKGGADDISAQRPRRTSHVDDVQERARRISQAEGGKGATAGDSQQQQRARRTSEVDQRPRRTSHVDAPGGAKPPAQAEEGGEYRGRRTSVVDSERAIDRERRQANMERMAERDRAKAIEAEKRNRGSVKSVGGATGELPSPGGAPGAAGSSRPSSHRAARRLSQSEMPSMTTDNATRMRRLSQTITAIPSIKAVAGSMAEEAAVNLKVAGITQATDESSRYVTDYLQGCNGFAIIGMVSEMGQERDEWKRDNQDKVMLVDDYGVNKDEVLVGVFDGHGPSGTSAAEFVADDMKEEMHEQMDTLAQNPAAVFSHAFQTVNMNLRRSYVDCKLSGTTAAVVHLKETTLTCAWVGDSRAVLGRLMVNEQGFSLVQAVQLSQDHKPGLPDEMARITVSGGRVDRLIIDETGERVGPLRVFTKYTWSPGLAISRSMGDIFAHDVGVIAEPDIRTHVIKPTDRFLILGTKGLWAFLSNEDAVATVVGNRDPQDAAQLLLKKAKELWQENEGDTRDDISVIVINFNHEALEEAAEARLGYVEDNYTDSEAEA